MAIAQELYCPHCGAAIFLNQGAAVAKCDTCGRMCLIEQLVTKKIEVTHKMADSDVDNLVQTALNLWLIDDPSAANLVNKALPLAPNDFRIWVLKSLVEKRDVSGITASIDADPIRDLDFCLTVLDNYPDAIGMIGEKIKHPLIQAISDIENLTKYFGEDGFVITIYDDELDTGFDKAKLELLDISERLENDIDLICASPKLTMLSKRIVKEDLMFIMMEIKKAISGTTSDSQTMWINYHGKPLIGKIMIFSKGRTQNIRMSKTSLYLESHYGKYLILDNSGTGKCMLMIPRMPRLNNVMAPVGPNCGAYLVHTYKLGDGIYINVDTRSHELPCVIDKSGYATSLHDLNQNAFDGFYFDRK